MSDRLRRLLWSWLRSPQPDDAAGYPPIAVPIPLTGHDRDRILALAEQIRREDETHSGVLLGCALVVVRALDYERPQWRDLPPEALIGVSPQIMHALQGMAEGLHLLAGRTGAIHDRERATEMGRLYRTAHTALAEAQALADDGIVVDY